MEEVKRLKKLRRQVERIKSRLREETESLFSEVQSQYQDQKKSGSEEATPQGIFDTLMNWTKKKETKD